MSICICQLDSSSAAGESIVSSLELPQIFSDVIGQVMPLVKAECLSIILRENNHLIYLAADGLEAGQLLGRQIPLQDGVPGEVMRTGNVVHVAEEDGRFNMNAICPCNPQSLIAVPLALGQNRLGLIQAAHRQPHADIFAPGDAPAEKTDWLDAVLGSSFATTGAAGSRCGHCRPAGHRHCDGFANGRWSRLPALP